MARKRRAKPPTFNQFQVGAIAERLRSRFELPTNSIDLLIEAMSSPDFLGRACGVSAFLTRNNRLLAHLGDSVLELVVRDTVIDSNRESSLHEISTMRSYLTRRQTLAEVAHRVELDQYLFKTDPLRPTPSNTLAEVVEALVGAAFKAGGYEEAKRFVLYLLETSGALARASEALAAPKTDA